MLELFGISFFFFFPSLFSLSETANESERDRYDCSSSEKIDPEIKCFLSC